MRLMLFLVMCFWSFMASRWKADDSGDGDAVDDDCGADDADDDDFGDDCAGADDECAAGDKEDDAGKAAMDGAR